MGATAWGRTGRSGPSEQRRRRIHQPKGVLGYDQGKHIIDAPGITISCNCGGCIHGKRIQQKPQIINLGR